MARPNQLLSKVVSTLGQCCCFPASFESSTNTDKSSNFSRCTKKHFPNLELDPNSVLIELFQIAIPMIVLPEDDHTDFAQEERLDLPSWTMISAICVMAEVSKCLDILTLGFSMKTVHLPL